jgi:hypothetical protein
VTHNRGGSSLTAISFAQQRILRGRRVRTPIERLAVGCLDAGNLNRIGVFHDRRALSDPSRWPEIERMWTGRYFLRLELRNQVTRQHIQISWTHCHYGGWRPWLHCPFCNRRVLKLFRGMGGYFCRPCIGNPPYASQTKSKESRPHFEACKLRLRLGGVASLTAPFPERPRGMHRRTYARLRRRAEELEAGLSARVRAKPADYPNLIYHFR